MIFLRINTCLVIALPHLQWGMVLYRVTYMYEMPSIGFQTFFVQAFKIVVLAVRFDYIYICIYIRGAYDKFPDFFVQAFKFVVDSWKFTMLLLYILWDDWPIFMISGSNEQLQQQLEHTLLKPDFHCWWISKMQSGREDTLDERYAIKLCFKLAKNDATKTYGMLQNCFSTILHESTISFWVA